MRFRYVLLHATKPWVLGRSQGGTLAVWDVMRCKQLASRKDDGFIAVALADAAVVAVGPRLMRFDVEADLETSFELPGPIEDALFDPTGAHVALTGDAMIWMVETKNGRVMATMDREHTAKVRFAVDGSAWAMSTPGRTRVFGLPKNTMLGEFVGETLALAPGAAFAVVQERNERPFILDLTRRARRALEPCAGLPKMLGGLTGLTSNGALVWRWSAADGVIELYDTEDGRCLGWVSDPEIETFVVGSDDRLLVITAGSDAEVSVWAMEHPGQAWARAMTHQRHVLTVDALEFHGSTGTLVSVGDGNVLKAWSLAGLFGDEPMLEAPQIVLDPRGTSMAYQDESGDVYLAGVAMTDSPRMLIRGGRADEIRWGSAEVLLVRKGSQIDAWDVEGLRRLGSVDVSSAYPSGIFGTEVLDGTSLVLVSGRSEPANGASAAKVTLWDLETGGRRGAELFGSYSVSNHSEPRRSRAIVSGRLIDTVSGESLDMVSSSAVFTPDGAQVLDISEDGNVLLRDSESGKILKYSGFVNDASSSSIQMDGIDAPWAAGDYRISFSPTGDRVAIVIPDGAIALGPFPELERQGAPFGTGYPVERLEWSPDGRQFVSIGQGVASLWNADRSAPAPATFEVPPRALVRFSPTLPFLAISVDPNALVVVDTDSRKRLFQVVMGPLRDVGFDAGDEALYIVEDDVRAGMRLRRRGFIRERRRWADVAADIGVTPW